MTRFILLVIGLLIFVASYSWAVDKPLVVYLPLDEADPDDFKDLSPNENDVTAEGGKSVDGRSGRAFKFDDTSEYVEVPNNENLNPTEEVTVEAWVYIEKRPSAWSALVGKNPYSVGYLMWIEAGMGPRGLIWVAGTRYNVDSRSMLTEKKWYHVCYTAKQGEMKIYIDGELTGTTAIPKGEFGTNANALRVGGQGGGTGFEGIIDEVAVYSVALTPEEIKQDMEKGIMSLAVQLSDKLATTWAEIRTRSRL